jgi:hypothetical protein
MLLPLLPRANHFLALRKPSVESIIAAVAYWHCLNKAVIGHSFGSDY